MSLDNIQLPSIVIADLFKNSLVDLNSKQVVTDNIQKPLFAFLGNNNKGIIILVKDEEAVYLKEQELSFLLGILTACKLSMADVALINLHKTHTNYNLLREQFAAEKILLFGVKPSQIDMPLDFPQYQLQKYNGQVYMCAPALAHLMEDRLEKTKLWNMLKQLFGLA